MNANKTLSFLCVFSAAFFGLTSSVFAAKASEGKATTPESLAAEISYTAPAMYHVGEFVIQHPRIANPKASGNCGASTGEILEQAVNAVKVEGLPASSVLDAKPKNPAIERIDLFPDIVTVQPRENECATWVSLTAQSRAALLLEPVTTPRNLVVTYWSGGLMVASTMISHPTVMREALQKLTQQLGRQYRADQPPPVKEPTEKK